MPQFDIDHHFGVFIEAGDPTYFRWGVSSWNDGGVWAGNVFDYVYTNFSSVCTEVTVSMGVSINGAQATPDGSTATIILTALNADPLDGMFIKNGNRVKFTLENYLPGETSHQWWLGWIKSIERDVDADGLNRVIINAGDQLEALTSIVGTISVVPDQTFAQRWDSIGTAAIDAGYGHLDTSWTDPAYEQFTFTGIDIFEEPLADTITNTMNGECGWLIASPDGAVRPVSHGFLDYALSLPSTSADAFFTADETDSHIAVTYINQAASTDTVVNNIKAALSWDAGTTVTATNQDAVDLYGLSTFDTTVDLANATQLTNWANYAVTLTGQQRIKALSVDAIAHKNRHLHNVYALYPFSLVNVNVTMGQTAIDENYIVNKITHHITPTTWLTDLELWRH